MSFLRSLRIPLSNAARGPASVASYARRMLSSSTEGPMIKVEFPASGGGKFAIIKMARGPVNSIHLPFMQELTNAIDTLEKDKSVQGFILASDCKRVYCGGLDLMAIHNPTLEGIGAFWSGLQDLWLKLYSTPLATVAAVSGAAPAAGCMLAMSCDYRVMASGYVIGMNETKFGLVAPPFFISTLVNTVGQRKAELLLTKGTLVSTSDALKLGMIDEEVAEEEVMAAAEREMLALISVNEESRRATKEFLRKETCRVISAQFPAEKKYILNWIMADEIQAYVGQYIAALKSKKK